MEYRINISYESNENFKTFLHKKIREYNNEHSFHHREKRKADGVKPINIMVSDEDDHLLGGLNADLYWGWLEINDFWVNEQDRGKGLGRTILSHAEEIAKQQGAKKSLLYTFDFQARTFYEQKDYKVVGEINDYPPGSSYYIMVKLLP